MNNNISIYKIGGSILDHEDKIARIIDGICPKFSGKRVLIVHGGGYAITSLLDRLSIESEFVDGQRVTDRKTMEIVEMVLSGSINKKIVSGLNKKGFRAIGLSGKDNKIALAEIIDEKLGFAGKVIKVDSVMLCSILDLSIIPVLSPVCIDKKHNTLNVNADFFAAEVAAALDADELNLVTTTGGILKDGQLLGSISKEEAEDILRDGTVTDGMIPKLESSIVAMNGGVNKIIMMDSAGNEGSVIQ